MKQLRNNSSMKTRNLEDLEKIRQQIRGSILFKKRYSKYYSVQFYLEDALNNPTETQNILDSVRIIANDMCSRDYMMQWASVYKIQFIILLPDHHDAMEKLVELKIIPSLLRFLEYGDGYVNIAGAEVLHHLISSSVAQALEVVNNGGALALVSLLCSRHRMVKIEALLAIACASLVPVQYRDTLLESGVVAQVIVIVEEQLQQDQYDRRLMQCAVAALASLWSINPLPSVNLVENVLPVLVRVLVTANVVHCVSSIICKDASYTLFRILGDLNTERLEQIVNIELCHRLIILMRNALIELVQLVHQIVQILISRLQASLQVFIDQGLVRTLEHNLLQAPDQISACKTIQLILLNYPARIQILFDGNLIRPLIQILEEEDEFGEDEVKVEAISIITTAVMVGTDEQIMTLIDHDCTKFLCEYINNDKTRVPCIQALRIIMRAG